MTAIAIGLALLSAVSLAYGALLQHRGVSALGASPGALRLRALLPLLRSAPWLLGLLTLGAGMLANVVALSLAPVMVVQPVGAISLVLSVGLGVLHRGLAVDGKLIRAVIACACGVLGFVIASALIATTTPMTGTEAVILTVIGLTGAGAGALFMLVWRRPRQLVLISGAGMLFAFCATNVHVVSATVVQEGITLATLGDIPWWNAAALAASGLVGSWFVQAAYASGPPEMVIAGLTVIDPIVAVLLGILVLGEAEGATGFSLAVMLVCGALACFAVFILSRYHPDAVEAERRRSALKHGSPSSDGAPRSTPPEEVSDPARP